MDVGLLGALSGLGARSLLDDSSLFVEFKGALTEQYVLQQLVSIIDIPLYYYWTNENSTNGVDFLIWMDDEIIPVEVKASENLKAKSYKFFCEKFQPTHAVRASLRPYHEESWMVNVPLYAIGQLPRIVGDA